MPLLSTIEHYCHYKVCATTVAACVHFVPGLSHMLLLLPGTFFGIYLIPWKLDFKALKWQKTNTCKEMIRHFSASLLS